MLELKDVSAGYGKHSVLDGVTAMFEKSKLLSIVGVNGCGKSTLLKTALGILPLFEGEIRVDGKDLGSMSRTEIAKKVAYLSQGKNTPDMTVEQMVLHGRFPYLSYPRRYTDRDKAIARKAMEAVGIADLAHKPLYTLSGGLRQNAYIAMALTQDTDYIFLDEPTTYLDISHQFHLMKLLRDLVDQGKGIVAVMHDLPMAFDFSDEILIMEKGRIKARSTPKELCENSVIWDIFNVRIRRTADGGQYYYDRTEI